MDCKCNACGQFTAACRCSDAAAEVQAKLDAQAAQDAADLEAGRALRRLVASGKAWKIEYSPEPVHAEYAYAVFREEGNDWEDVPGTGPTLPEAVAAALGDVP